MNTARNQKTDGIIKERKDEPEYTEEKKAMARRHYRKKAMEKLQLDKTTESETATEEEAVQVRNVRPPKYETGEINILSIK